MTDGAMQVSQTLLLLALLLLITGTAVAALALGGRTWLRLPGVALASAGSAAWLLLDKTLEGPLLVDLEGAHGLVLADLLVLPAVVLCAWLAVDDARQRRAAAPQRVVPGPQAIPGEPAVPAAREAPPAGEVSRTGPAGPG